MVGSYGSPAAHASGSITNNSTFLGNACVIQGGTLYGNGGLCILGSVYARIVYPSALH